jgi:hypothetical protein
MKGLQLSTEDKQLVIEALLFTASSDVCSEHTALHRKKMIQLAEKLNVDAGKLYNIFIFNEKKFEEVETKLILEKFKNIPLHDIIAD